MVRRFFATQSGTLSNEDENLEPTAGDTGSEEALATVMAEGEAADAEADAAMNEANVADGLEGVIALENMRLTLRAANENGGMDRFGAMAVKQQLDFVMHKFLKSPTGISMPSNESFGGAGSRVGSGVLTMESIKESSKKIWDAIVKFLKKMKDKVMGWLNKIFGAAEKLAKRADAVKARADGVKGSPKEKTFDNAAIFAALAIKDAVEPTAFKSSLGSISKLAEAMIKESVDTNAETVKVMDVMEGITPANFAAEIAKVKAIINAGASVTPVIGDGVEMPGNVKMRVPKVVDAGQPSERFEGYGLPSNGSKAKTDAKVPTLDLEDIKAVCTMVKSIAETLVATRKVQPASEKAYKRVEDYAKKQMSESDMADSTDTAAKTEHADAVKMFKMGAAGVDGPIKALAGYIMKTARSSLDYCDASLGQYA